MLSGVYCSVLVDGSPLSLLETWLERGIFDHLESFLLKYVLWGMYICSCFTMVCLQFRTRADS